MTLVNFKLDTDADGIALVTWDMPGRSMNLTIEIDKRPDRLFGAVLRAGPR